MSRNHPAPDAYVAQGDTAPAIADQLKDGTGAVVNLTGATVRFHMWAPGAAAVKVDALATITDAALGKVAYTWLTADTDTPADYLFEWKVTFSGGAIERFPNGRDRWVRVKRYVAA